MYTLRQIDSIIAENFCGIKIVHHNWPCYYSPDDGYYTASLHEDELSDYVEWGGELGPVYDRAGHGWPPKDSNTDIKLFGTSKKYAYIYPIPFYSKHLDLIINVILSKNYSWSIKHYKINHYYASIEENDKGKNNVGAHRICEQYNDIPLSLCLSLIDLSCKKSIYLRDIVRENYEI